MGMGIKFKIAWLFLMLFFLTLVSQGEENQGLNPDSAYLIDMYPFKKRSNGKGLVPLNLYDNKEFKGEPIMVFDDKGLKIKGKLVCMWNARYPEDPMLKEIHNNQRSSQPCPRQGPIVSGEDSPVIIEVKDILSDGYYETTKYEGGVLYIDKKETEVFEYRESKYAVQNAEIAKNKSAYEELKKTDKSLVEFLDKWNKCVEKKDQKCLPKDKSRDLGFNEVDDLWRDYACIKNEEIYRDPQCSAWLKFRCNSRYHLNRDVKCDNVVITEARPKLTKEFDKKAKDFVWNALSRCFAKVNLEKNYVMVDKDSDSFLLTLQTRDDEPQVSCKIWKNWKKNSAWVLEAIIDQSDFRLDGEFKVY